MWTLIIAIMFSHGVAIDHIDGFQTKQACDVAIAQFWQHEDHNYQDNTTLVCTSKAEVK